MFQLRSVSVCLLLFSCFSICFFFFIPLLKSILNCPNFKYKIKQNHSNDQTNGVQVEHNFILSHISSSAHECVQWFRILVSHWPDWEFFMVSKSDNKNWQAIAFKWNCDHKVNPHRFDFRWRSYSWDIRDIRCLLCMVEYAQNVHTYKYPETHVNRCINKSSQDRHIHLSTE